jgi:antitoxin component YwqK of YwqJK toxin-antitoxin module
MKKFFIFILLITSCSANIEDLEERDGIFYKIASGERYSGQVNIYYLDNTVKENFNLDNGIRSGPYLTYYKNGTTHISGNFKEGHKNGLELEFDQSGFLIGEKEYSSGRLKNIQEFYKNGKLKYSKRMEENYESMIGWVNFYHESFYSERYGLLLQKKFKDKKLISSTEYKSALIGMDGINSSYRWKTYYDENEKPIESCQWSSKGNGKQFCEIYCPNGKIKETESYDNGMFILSMKKNDC